MKRLFDLLAIVLALPLLLPIMLLLMLLIRLKLGARYFFPDSSRSE